MHRPVVVVELLFPAGNMVVLPGPGSLTYWLPSSSPEMTY